MSLAADLWKANDDWARRILAHGFVRGLTPARPSLGPMNTLASTLLDVFGS